MYIAFTYPWSYDESNQYFDNVQKKIQMQMADQIYFHRELLGYSLEERQVELITITGHNSKLDEREDTIAGLFPDIKD